ncbi:MAG TPA: TonB-dependent receptor [Acidobacteriota bacterium]
MKLKHTAFLITGALALVLAPLASAQLTFSGSIYGKVTDNTGAALPGVLVTLESTALIASQTSSTGPAGSYRFAGLPPGKYKVTAKLDGYNTVVRDGLTVGIGISLNVNVEMAIAAVAETVTVTGEAPLVDSKSNTLRSSFNSTALEEVPSARDPWVILEQAAGIQMDRINVGGNESGQQSTFTARGDSGDNTMWNIDGVNIVDPAAVGASPTYFDFSAFEEIQVTTGGNDPSQMTGGIGINIITKQGGNRFSGNGHLYVTDNDLQDSNRDAHAAEPCNACPDRTIGSAGNEIVRITDVGFDVGGPAMKDRIWFWGSYGKQDIRNNIITGAADNTQLENFVVKFNGQVTSRNTATVFHHRGDKTKQGRGVSPNRPAPTSWNQFGPSPITKLEDQHIFSDNFFLAGKVGIIKGGFGLTPIGGLEPQVFWDISNNVWSGSFQDHVNSRPHYTGNLDGNYFMEAAGGDHEFKFGYQFSRASVTNNTQWPHDNWVLDFSGGNVGNRYGYVYVFNGYPQDQTDRVQAHSLYFGDTYTRDRLTLNLGVRFDRQTPKNLPNEVPASSLAPDLVPARSFPGFDPGYEFNDVVPRLGFTYDITGDGKTLIRGNYAQYAGIQSLAVAARTNAGAYGYIVYYWADLNGDDFVQRNEVRDDLGGLAYVNIDPNDRTSATSPNITDPDLTADHTKEFIVGLDREISQDLAVSASFIWRRLDDFTFLRKNGEDPSLWVPIATVTGTASGNPGRTATILGQPTGILPGQLTLNNDFYYETYKGFEVSATKRLSNRWMATASFTYNDHIGNWDDPLQGASLDDGTASNPFRPENIPFLDGQDALIQSTGSGAKGNVFLNAKYTFKLSGLYQLPYNWTVGGFYQLRDGYPNPARLLSGAGGFGTNSYYDEPFGERRLEDVSVVNLRIEKNTSFGEGLNLGVGIDIFNALNDDVILQRERNLNASTFDRLNEIISPRVIRLGARFSF